MSYRTDYTLKFLTIATFFFLAFLASFGNSILIGLQSGVNFKPLKGEIKQKMSKFKSGFLIGKINEINGWLYDLDLIQKKKELSENIGSELKFLEKELDKAYFSPKKGVSLEMQKSNIQFEIL